MHALGVALLRSCADGCERSRQVGRVTLPLIDTTLRTGGRLASLNAKQNGYDANV